MRRFPLPLYLTVLAMSVVGAIGAYQAEGDRGHAEPRSPKWPAVRRAYLEKHPDCEACGRTARQGGPIEVHHVVPFHDDEAKELDPDNLIALCRRCHELVGHLDKWSSYNRDVRDDASKLLKKIKERP